MNVTPTQGCALPQFVRDLLASPPKVGEGVNSWLYRVARVLHPYRAEPEIIALIGSAIHGEHIRPSEIVRAVRNSKSAAWHPGEPLPSSRSTSEWPEANLQEINRISANGPTVTDLLQMTLGGCGMDEDDGSNCVLVVTSLFSTTVQPDPLLCLAKNQADFATRPLSVWTASGKLPTTSLIVPSPMSKRTGITKEGKESEHCLDNTGPRRFVVVESDKTSHDTQAAVLWHLAGFGELALVVHSGGRSLQGWYYARGESDPAVEKFMRYATSLGGDAAVFRNPSQFVRLPGGTRDNGCRQSILYFRPDVIRQKEVA